MNLPFPSHGPEDRVATNPIGECGRAIRYQREIEHEHGPGSVRRLLDLRPGCRRGEFLDFLGEPVLPPVGGLGLLLGDFLYLRWRLERVFTVERFVALALVVAVALVLGPNAPAWVTVGAEGLVLTAMQALLGRRPLPASFLSRSARRKGDQT